MLNILTCAENKHAVIKYFLKDGYMSKDCFNKAMIRYDNIYDMAKAYLIHAGIKEK